MPTRDETKEVAKKVRQALRALHLPITCSVRVSPGLGCDTIHVILPKAVVDSYYGDKEAPP